MPVASHIQPVLNRALDAFAREFGGEPRWAAAAPGRVNLIGEHTDYNGGFVLPIAIDRVCVVVGGPSRDPAVSRIVATDIRQSATADLRAPLRVKAAGEGGAGVERGSWLSYILGVVAQFQVGRTLGNLDIVIASSVPLGSGLSSSAAVEVATATLMEEVTSTKLDTLAKARLCQKAEHEFAGVPCGIMDMLASIAGQAGHALLIDCESNDVRPVRIPEGTAFLVVNTNVKHALAGGEYARRRAACESAAETLGVASLRRANPDSLDSRLSPEELRCARHVISENRRTQAAAQALCAGDFAQLGRMMVGSHASLRDDYRVSCRELDEVVEEAMTQSEVFGARMTGAGFGGCALVAVRPEAMDKVSATLRARFEREFGRTCDCFEVRASAGARVL